MTNHKTHTSERRKMSMGKRYKINIKTDIKEED